MGRTEWTERQAHNNRNTKLTFHEMCIVDPFVHLHPNTTTNYIDSQVDFKVTVLASAMTKNKHTPLYDLEQ